MRGDALPSIRAFANDLKVSVLTIRRMYEELEQEGFIIRILGLCAFEPDDESEYCYWLDEYENNGFGYRITANPSSFETSQIYPYKVISLAVAWLNKEDYGDADLVTFLALTSVIG